MVTMVGESNWTTTSEIKNILPFDSAVFFLGT